MYHVDLKGNTIVTEWRPSDKTVTIQCTSNNNSNNSDEKGIPSTICYDYLVLACGVVTDPATGIPGIENHMNICTFESLDRQTAEARDFCQSAAAKTDKEKHVFVLAIGECPYKCPVAPFELTFLLEEMAIKAGVRAKCQYIITCPLEWPMPPSTKPIFEKAMQERGIEFRGNHEMVSIDDESVISYKNGKHIKADLIWAVHPIAVPQFVRHALPNQIVDGSVNIEDCISHKIPNLANSYAIGDCCRVQIKDDNNSSNNLTIPKAGEFALKMGQSVADDILNKGNNDSIYANRTGKCIAEIGVNQGITVENDFSAIIHGGKHQVQAMLRKDNAVKLKMDWDDGDARLLTSRSSRRPSMLPYV